LQLLSLCLIISASVNQVALSDLPEFSESTDPANIGLTRSAAGWLIFVGVIALLYELVVIILRFLNVGPIHNNMKLVAVVVGQ
jgi:uncharacterized membrane protein